METGRATKGENDLLRVLTTLGKLYTAKLSLATISECIEALGGNGYMEDATDLPELLREQQVPSLPSPPPVTLQPGVQIILIILLLIIFQVNTIWEGAPPTYCQWTFFASSTESPAPLSVRPSGHARTHAYMGLLSNMSLHLCIRVPQPHQSRGGAAFPLGPAEGLRRPGASGG